MVVGGFDIICEGLAGWPLRLTGLGLHPGQGQRRSHDVQQHKEEDKDGQGRAGQGKAKREGFVIPARRGNSRGGP